MAFPAAHSELCFLNQMYKNVKNGAFSTDSFLINPLLISSTNVFHQNIVTVPICGPNAKSIPDMYTERHGCYLEFLRYILSFQLVPEVFPFPDELINFSSNFIKHELYECFQNIVNCNYTSKCRFCLLNLQQNYLSINAENDLPTSDFRIINIQEQLAFPVVLARFIAMLNKYSFSIHFQNAMSLLPKCQCNHFYAIEKYASIRDRNYVPVLKSSVRNWFQMSPTRVTKYHTAKYNQIRQYKGRNAEFNSRCNIFYCSSNKNHLSFCFSAQNSDFQVLNLLVEKKITNVSYLCNKLMILAGSKSSLISNSVINYYKFLFSAKNVKAFLEIKDCSDSESKSGFPGRTTICDSVISRNFLSTNDLGNEFTDEPNIDEYDRVSVIEDDENTFSQSQCYSKKRDKTFEERVSGQFGSVCEGYVNPCFEDGCIEDVFVGEDENTHPQYDSAKEVEELEKNVSDQFDFVHQGYVNPCVEDDIFVSFESERIKSVNERWQKLTEDVKKHSESNKKVSFRPFPELVTIREIDAQDEIYVDDKSESKSRIRFPSERTNELESLLLPLSKQQYCQKMSLRNSLGNS